MSEHSQTEAGTMQGLNVNPLLGPPQRLGHVYALQGRMYPAFGRAEALGKRHGLARGA